MKPPFACLAGAIVPWSRLCTIVLALTTLTSPGFVTAADQVSITAVAETSTVKPGQRLTLTIIAEVAEGYHAQSHTPSDPNYIPFTIRISPVVGASIDEPQYPAGVDQTYAELGKLNVYTGQVTVTVGVTIAPGAAAGPLKIKGVVRSQSCNESSCFAPKSTPFEVVVTVKSGPTTQASVPPPFDPAQSGSAAAVQRNRAVQIGKGSSWPRP